MSSLLDFKTPEEFFLDETPAKFEWKSIDPQKFLDGATKKDEESYHSEVRDF